MNINGFVLKPKLFTLSMQKKIAAEIHMLLNNILSIHKVEATGSIEDKMIFLYKKDLPSYLNTVKAFSRLSSIQQAFISPSILKICHKLGLKHPLPPTTPVVHIISDQLKIPDGYFGQAAHQDWASMQGSLNALVFWVALTDVSCDNYPVEIVPGSHLRGLIQGEVNSHHYALPADCISEQEFRPVQCLSGDALIFSSFLVHRTAVQNKSGFRLAISFRFDDAADTQFVERGFHTAYKRIVDRALDPADIPSIDSVRKTYGMSN